MRRIQIPQQLSAKYISVAIGCASAHTGWLRFSSLSDIIDT